MEMTNLNDTAEFFVFTGTSGYHLYLAGAVLTDGVKHLADEYQCYWFLDQIAERRLGHPKESFQVWSLKRTASGSNAFKITATDGNHNVLETIDIPFSDFKAGEVDIWVVDDVMLLPSEY